MTTATLTKPVRAPSGPWHQPGEALIVLGTVRRADFDDTALLRVRFSDGTPGMLRLDEVESCQQSAVNMAHEEDQD